MFEKQAQELSGDGVAIQAGGSVSVVVQKGLSVTDVQELVQTFLHIELPAFREEARRIAEENARKLLNAFVEKAAASQAPLSAEEFTKPTGQAAFQSALQGVALHADDADIDLVAQALVQRLSSGHQPLMKRVLEKVIQVLPQIGAPDISLLALVVFAGRIKFPTVKSPADIEPLVARYWPLLEPSVNVSSATLQYLASLSLVTINPVSDFDWLIDRWCNTYGIGFNRAEMEQAQQNSFLKFHDAFVALRVPTIHPTIVGTAIGLLHLKRELPDLDLATFIS
jgi:hypothetical protein